MLKRMLRRLKKEGFVCEIVTMSEGNQAIMVTTNYTGYYPTQEVFNIHAQLQKMFRKCRYEQRGFYTGALLTPIEA